MIRRAAGDARKRALSAKESRLDILANNAVALSDDLMDKLSADHSPE